MSAFRITSFKLCTHNHSHCQQKQFKEEDQGQLRFLWRAVFTEHPDIAVIAAGFHGVVKTAGAPDGLDKQRGHQLPEGTQRLRKLIFPSRDFWAILMEWAQSSKQKYSGRSEASARSAASAFQFFQYLENVGHGRTAGQKIQAGYGCHGGYKHPDRIKRVSRLAVRYQLPKGMANTSSGV